jgi:hypothetical protein
MSNHKIFLGVRRLVDYQQLKWFFKPKSNYKKLANYTFE